jgi:hypothetical protein
MPKLADVLKQSGLTDEQIAAIDAKALAAADTYVSKVEKDAQDLAVKAEADRKAKEVDAAAAKTAQEAAELQKRSVDEFWTNTYNPGIAAWEVERTKLAKAAADAAAEAAFYKTQRETYLKELNIDPSNAPAFAAPTPVPAADQNRTPGTPTFTIDDVRNEMGTALGTVANIQWEYQTLYGRPMPISPTDLLRQAEANKFKDPATYASQIFKFAEKREEIRQTAAKAHDDEIAKNAAEAKETEWKAKLDAREIEIAAEKKKLAEGAGSNPDVKLPPGSSKFADLQRATKAGERPDPTKLTPQERRQSTFDNIHKALEERQAVVA